MISFNGNEQEVIKSLEDTSNKYQIVIDDFNKQNHKINDLDPELKDYLRKSFIKMIDLFASSFKLLGGVCPYPNESKIIIRSMYEHYITFLYILEGDEKNRKNKIERFFDYQKKVSPFSLLYREYDSLKNDKKNEYFQMIEKEIERYEVKKHINDFKNKYNIPKTDKYSINYWSGKSFKKIFYYLFEQTKQENPIYFYRIYSYLCEYTHSNALYYYDEDKKEYTNKPKVKDVILCLVYMNLFFSQFLTNFYTFTQMDWDSNVKINYSDKFNEIIKKYDIKF